MSPASYRAAPPRAVVFTTLTTTSDKRKSSRTAPRGPPPGIAGCPLPAPRAGPGALRGEPERQPEPRARRAAARRRSPVGRWGGGRREVPQTPRRSSVALVAAHDHVPVGGGRLCWWPSQPRVGHADHAAHERHRATGRLAPARTPTGPRPRPVRELHRGRPGPSRTRALLGPLDGPARARASAWTTRNQLARGHHRSHAEPALGEHHPDQAEPRVARRRHRSRPPQPGTEAADEAPAPPRTRAPGDARAGSGAGPPGPSGPASQESPPAPQGAAWLGQGRWEPTRGALVRGHHQGNAGPLAQSATRAARSRLEGEGATNEAAPHAAPPRPRGPLARDATRAGATQDRLTLGAPPPGPAGPRPPHPRGPATGSSPYKGAIRAARRRLVQRRHRASALAFPPTRGGALMACRAVGVLLRRQLRTQGVAELRGAFGHLRRAQFHRAGAPELSLRQFAAAGVDEGQP